MEELKKIRDEIGSLDNDIVKLLSKRMELVKRAGKYKKSISKQIVDIKREEELIEKIEEYNLDELYIDNIINIYTNIIHQSRKVQSKIIIPYNISLIGFMGVGKTTIGKDLSQRFAMDWVDLDDLIESEEQAFISDIFKNHGEKYFRDIETKYLKSVLIDSKDNKENFNIISCGGGIVLKDENINIMKQNSKIVLLELKIDTIIKRIKEDINRPVSYNKSIQEIIDIYNNRISHYKNAADIVIKVDNKEIAQISDEIIARLSN